MSGESESAEVRALGREGDEDRALHLFITNILPVSPSALSLVFSSRDGSIISLGDAHSRKLKRICSLSLSHKHSNPPIDTIPIVSMYLRKSAKRLVSAEVRRR